MNKKAFDNLVNEQFARCRDILNLKDSEYAVEEDRLHNFKVAAELKCETSRQAVMGMMAKHIVSVFDMGTSVKTYPDAVWDEKITDSINYFLLLKGVLYDEHNAALETEPSNTIDKYCH